MKKILLMAAFAVASLSANAQVWVGGGLGFNTEKAKDADAQTVFNIAPQIGYNLDEKLSLGLELGLKVANKAAGDYTDVVAAPFVRYTYAKMGIASLFVDGGFGLGSHKPSGVDASTVWHVGLRPGIAINLSDNLSIISQLGYLGYQHREDWNRFSLNANENALTLGVYYTF
ncbi:MAG: outer membrane beta-barrel protein [Bacteroidaceae bacterium]|nr:outer membrane beta-barrel protein [Bacteroidaceae bacterium]